MSEPVVVLRGFQDGDEDVLFRAQTEFETWEERSPGLPRPQTRDAWRERRAEREKDESAVQFVIESAGRPVGQCMLFDLDFLTRSAEAGIAVVAEARGQGVGTAAMRALVEFGFVRWNLRRIVLGVIGSNAPAIASYRRVGFVEEGRLREHCWVRGEYVDEIKMGLLRSEWAAPVTG